jgi:hypothetical protein
MASSQPCQSFGIYNANKSSSYPYNGSAFGGDFVSDTISIGEIGLDKMLFSLEYNVSSRVSGFLVSLLEHGIFV